MNEIFGANMRTLDACEMLWLSGGDTMPPCISATCGYLGKAAAGIIEAFANAPAASYVYGKCGM